MRLLILGGTSFFGKDIVRLFKEAGWEVTVFTRGQRPIDGTPAIQGNRKSREDLERVAKMGPWDLVIDNICFDAAEAKLATQVFKDVGRYILTSTVSVYRYVKNRRHAEPLKESSVDYSYHPKEENLLDIHWKYSHGKWEAERIVIEESKAPWTILRPPVVYGPNDVTDRGFWYLYRLKSKGPIIIPDGGVASFRLSYSVDVARSFLLAAGTEKAVGRTYNINQEEVITLHDFLVDSATALGVEADLVSIPSEFVGELGGPYSNMINLVPDITLATNELGFRHTPWMEFITTTAQWFSKNWKGNSKEITATRPQELDLIDRWKNQVRPKFA